MKIKILFILLFFFGGCSDNFEEEHESINCLIENYNLKLSDKKSVFLIIPVIGCGQCIEQSFEFVKENINVNYIYFIFYSNSYKEVATKFSKNETSRPNIIIDTKGCSLKLDKFLNKPIAIYLKNKKIVKKAIFSPNVNRSFFNDILIFN